MSDELTASAEWKPPYIGTLECEWDVPEINAATITSQEAHLQHDHAGETSYDSNCVRCARYVEGIMRLPVRAFKQSQEQEQ